MTDDAPHNAAPSPDGPRTSSADRHIAIVGAGLAGSLLACFMAKRGYTVSVHERRPDPRDQGFVGGRSINLALSTRGIHALEQVGLAENVLKAAIPMRGRMMHSPAGELTFQPYSANPDDAINSVSRGGLNITLLNAADQYDNVTLHFNQRCDDIDPDEPAATFHDESTGETTAVNADLIIGCDGAFSAVRNRLMKTDRFNYSQEFLAHGYKELTIPATDDGDFAMEPNALHIWPRGGYMMIALPNQDRSFTCTCFWPFSGPHGFEQLQTEDEIISFFKSHFPDAVPLMPTLVEDYQTNPTSSLVTIRCAPWHYRGKVVILGDAAHAIVPFYGQGMNAAFEDCTIFDQCVGRYASNWAAVLDEFTRLRTPDADAIADLALDNFIEMRDKVASKRFLLRKRIEQTLHKLVPFWYTPLYNMVTFSRIPYDEARRSAARKDRIVFRVIPAIILLVLLIASGLLIWLLLRDAP